MRMAAIGDIHGNSAALDAVLDAIDRLSVDLIVNLGDHFSGPLDALGTAERLMSRDMLSLLGNHDRYLIEQSPADMHASDQYAHQQLQAEHKHWLSSLPATGRFDDVFLCHATPHCDSTYWMEALADDGKVSMASHTHIEQQAHGIDAALLLCAHTHVPRICRLQDGRLLVNPGSVGCPAYDDVTPTYHVMQTGIPDASFALLDCENGQWRAQLHHVRYDASHMAKLARKANRPEWANAVTTGWL